MENKKYLLALDASLACTGYAVFDYKCNLIDKGMIDTQYIKCRDKEIHSEKLLCIFNSLNKLEHDYNFNEVIIERSFVQFNTTTKILHKVVGIIELLFNKKNIKTFSPKEIKKFVCNDGNADKEKVIKAVNFLYELELDTKPSKKEDNIADAIALGHYYLNKER